MAFIDILKHVKSDELTEDQKSDLTKTLQKRKRELAAAIKAVDQGLELVAPRPQPKAVAKKKAPAKR